MKNYEDPTLDIINFANEAEAFKVSGGGGGDNETEIL